MVNQNATATRPMHEDYCYNRLPCGICRLTNSQCPKCVGTTINWCDGRDSVTIATNKYTAKLGNITTEVHVS